MRRRKSKKEQSENSPPATSTPPENSTPDAAETAGEDKVRILLPEYVLEVDSGVKVRKHDGNRPTFANRVASVFRVIKFELLIGLLALLLSLGQYFQSVISIRINITEIWREGYTAETRDRVSKFRYLYRKWVDEYKKACLADACPKEHPDQTVVKLIQGKTLFSADGLLVQPEGQSVNGGGKQVLDPRIRELVSDEIDLLKMSKDRYEVREQLGPRANEQKSVATSPDYDLCLEEPCITREDYTRAALKYRDAIIECLNTAEAVKAVIRSRPLPFRRHLLYSDTLEGRYNDIIDELRTDLGGFIRLYRAEFSGRDTPAWFVLTSEESDENDYKVIRYYIFVFLLTLTVIYFIKRLFQPTT